MSIAQSAASFVGTKPAAERKPRITKSKSEVKPEVAAPTTFAALVAQIADAPKAAPKAPKVSKVGGKLELTAKGRAYNPSESRGRVRGAANVATWANIKAVFADNEYPTTTQVLDAIPTHRDFLGYALRSGWLAIVVAD